VVSVVCNTDLSDMMDDDRVAESSDVNSYANDGGIGRLRTDYDAMLMTSPTTKDVPTSSRYIVLSLIRHAQVRHGIVCAHDVLWFISCLPEVRLQC
jgi:hypothetical protein